MKVVGNVFPSGGQNGDVFDIDGLSPCLCVGNHSGVEPKIIEFPISDWVCEHQIPTPQTKDNCAPAITATYEYASFANMMDTAHYPRMGVIEIGHYE